MKNDIMEALDAMKKLSPLLLAGAGPTILQTGFLQSTSAARVTACNVHGDTNTSVEV